MEIEKRRIDELIEAPYNPRKIDEEVMDRLIKSIEEFGYVEPVILNERTGFVVGGNQRLKALKALGYDEVDVVLVDLDENKEKALNVALNKIQGDWDYPKLKELLVEIDTGEFDIELTGFDPKEIEEMIVKDRNLENDEDDFNAEKELNKMDEAKTKEGDIYQLGKHRLMCGDGTQKKDLKKLINEEEIDLVFTDPPYGINVVKVDSKGADNVWGGKKGKIGVERICKAGSYYPVKGDENTETAKTFYKHALDLGMKNFIIWGGNYFTDFLPVSRGWVVWNKIGNLEGTTLNFSDGELAWTSYNKPLRVISHRWHGLIKDSEHGKKRIHPTQKPIALAIKCFDLFEAGDNILDPFGGSGSFLMACEQTKRKCFMMESEELYCDLIIKRWENYTGEKAKLLKQN